MRSTKTIPSSWTKRTKSNVVEFLLQEGSSSSSADSWMLVLALHPDLICIYLTLNVFFFLSLKNIQRDQETFLVPFPLAVPNKVVCSALPHTKLLSCFSLLCSAVYIFINSMNITLCTFQDHLIDSAWTNVFHDN